MMILIQIILLLNSLLLLLNNENKAANVLGPTNAFYSCPLYKYPKRTDKYLITDIKLKISGGDKDDKFW